MAKTLTLFGASGNVGKLVVADALAQGYIVRAVVHTHDVFETHPNLTVIKGDIRDRATIKEALETADSVISTLGSWGTKQKDILNTAMKNIIPEMHTAGIGRIISLTGAEARATGDSLSSIHRLAHVGISVIGRKILRDSEQHIALLEKSTLDWTVIRSPIMTNATSSTYSLTTKRPLPWQTISRQSVAAALLSELGHEHHSQQALYVR